MYGCLSTDYFSGRAACQPSGVYFSETILRLRRRDRRGRLSRLGLIGGPRAMAACLAANSLVSAVALMPGWPEPTASARGVEPPTVVAGLVRCVIHNYSGY